MHDFEQYNEWFKECLATFGYEDKEEEVLEDIMMVHDLTPEDDFAGYIRQMDNNSFCLPFESYDDVMEWLMANGHI